MSHIAKTAPVRKEAPELTGQEYVETVVDLLSEPGRILIVDDEPFNVSGIKVMIQCLTAGIEHFKLKEHVESAFNGKQAVELVKKNFNEGKYFRLILMDCNMPVTDGYQATVEIRQFLKNSEQPAIVALTGHSEHRYIQRALDSGMDSVLNKPAKLQDVEEVLKKYYFD